MARLDPIRFRLGVFLTVFVAVMVLGTLGFMIVERISVADAFYFSIVTIATVGYGDIHPATQAGKVLAIVVIVLGVGTFLGVVANATEMMLNRREKQARLEKLNMVIGVFFSEVGTKLLIIFSEHDPHLAGIKSDLMIRTDWTDRDFARVQRKLKEYDYGIEIRKIDLRTLRDFLVEKRSFMVGLMENPVLLEHESFTELLHAVFHLTEELWYREHIDRLPDTDKAHLAGDINRVYVQLVYQWIDYMEHLKDNYPYLFSLAMRMNPFDREASPIVK
jgi:voltage-gated potassium channel